MRLVTQDGRTFEGTPLQVAQAMKAIAFGASDLSLSQYLDWVASEGMALLGTERHRVCDEDDVSTKAALVIDAMVRHGFATPG